MVWVRMVLLCSVHMHYKRSRKICCERSVRSLANGIHAMFLWNLYCITYTYAVTYLLSLTIQYLNFITICWFYPKCDGNVRAILVYLNGQTAHNDYFEYRIVLLSPNTTNNGNIEKFHSVSTVHVLPRREWQMGEYGILNCCTRHLINDKMLNHLFVLAVGMNASAEWKKEEREDIVNIRFDLPMT